MPIFIVRIELHHSDKEQACSAVHDSMSNAGFSRIYKDEGNVRYHLPGSEYCINSTSSADAIRDLASAATAKVTTHFMVLVSETIRIAIAGLVPVREAGAVAVLTNQAPTAQAAWAHR